MIDPAKVCFFIPPELKAFKLKLFDRIGQHIQKKGGRVVRGDHNQLAKLPADVAPIIGCSPVLTPMLKKWRAEGRPWIYWDRGYARRVFATDLPPGREGGYYRWHVNSFQMQSIRKVSDDRWRSLCTDVAPWKKDGKHIVLAEPSKTYQKFHDIGGWTERTIEALRKVTDRPIVRRDKEMQVSGRKLHQDLKGAHCLVTHGSNAAVEAAIMGCPVFVHQESAAALIGRTDLDVENPVYPDRSQWLHSLAHCQFNEVELVNGELWRLLQ